MAATRTFSGLKLTLGLALGLSFGLSGCGAPSGTLAPVSDSALEADSLPREARTVQSPIGPITLGLIPDKVFKSPNRREDDELSSYEGENGLEGFTIQAQPLPKAVDLRRYCAPVRNQGTLGSCTAFAATGLMEAMYNIKGRDRELSKIGHFSPLFFYYAERKLIEESGDIPHATKKDTGASSTIAAHTATKIGVVPESMVPYKDGRPALAYDATAAQYEVAKAHRFGKRTRISTLHGMKHALSNKRPFLLGIVVYDSFMSAELKETGMMTVPTRQERPVGGHAVVAVGYDDAKQAFIVRNSWGSKWGDGGYFYMPYSFFKTSYVGLRYFACWTLE